MAKSKLDRAIVIILIICLVILVYFGVCGIVFFRKKTISVGVFNQSSYIEAYTKLTQEFVEEKMPNKHYKKVVEKDMGVKFYIYSERILKKHSGLTFPTIRTIILDERLEGYEYCVTFAHELMHIKKFIQQERYVCYETFKYLYESEELHNVGVWYGLKQLNGDYSGEYDISGLVVNYLTNK